MPLQLLHRLANTLQPWIREDQQIPVGLDRATFYVVDVIQLDQPALQPGQQAIPADPVIVITDPDSQGINGTVTLGWQVVSPPPPPPEPDWDAFREGLRTQNGYQEYFAQAAQQQLLTAASLPVDFYDFRKSGNYGSFLTLLSQVFSLLPLQDRIHGLTEMIQLSQNCHLPQAFIDELIHLAQSPAP